jgi:hypothetical protein
MKESERFSLDIQSIDSLFGLKGLYIKIKIKNFCSKGLQYKYVYTTKASTYNWKIIKIYLFSCIILCNTLAVRHTL